MKKIVFSLVLLFLVASFANATEKIVVGATPVPHAEILEVIKPELAKEGYSLDIKIFNDYVIPNIATDSGELDANFFQHLPYLKEFNKNKGTKLINTVSVHIEPMGIYSKKIKDLKDLKKGAKVSIPNDPTNESRALEVLATAGLIKLSNAELKTPLDITENPKKLKFVEIEAASLPRTLDDVDISVINTNFALNINLNPKNDALALENKDSPYANIIVVSEKNKDSKKTKALNKAIQSEAVKKFIDEKYKGAILPAF